MQVELVQIKNSSLAATLQQRAERALDAVAPYEHVSRVLPKKGKVGSSGEVREPPRLQVNGFTVIAGNAGPLSPDPSSSAQALVQIPSEADIRSAVTSALLKEGPKAVHLPLQHRQFIMAGGLAILVGALLGQLVSWGPAVTFLGVSLLPIGFSSNGRRAGRQPLMLMAGGFAALWLACTLWSWAPRLLNLPLTTQAAPTAIFWVGVVAFATAWLVALRAAFVRWHLRKDLRDQLASKHGAAS